MLRWFATGSQAEAGGMVVCRKFNHRPYAAPPFTVRR